MLTNGLEILLLAEAGAPRALLEGAITTSLPTTVITPVDPPQLEHRMLPELTGCAVVDRQFGARGAVEALMALRASGFEGPAVLVVDEPDDAVAAHAREIGAAACVRRNDVATALAPAILEATSADEESAAMQELRRTQRLVATGTIAIGFQHAVNNPLTALLAESQLLAMEPMPEEQKAAVQRIVDVTRRVVATVARLQVIASDPGRERPTPKA